MYLSRGRLLRINEQVQAVGHGHGADALQLTERAIEAVRRQSL